MAGFTTLSPGTVRALLCSIAVLVPSSRGDPAQFQYGYDSAGRLVAAATGAGAATYAYDSAGRPVQRNFSPLADEDGDGLVTAQEFLLGTNPTDADSDDDGLNDGAEDTAGTDPLNAGSRLVVASVVIAQGGAVDLTVASTAGRYYTLQSSTELGEWVDEPEAMAVPGTGAVLTLHDANPDAGRKFYRIAVRR